MKITSYITAMITLCGAMLFGFTPSNNAATQTIAIGSGSKVIQDMNVLKTNVYTKAEIDNMVFGFRGDIKQQQPKSSDTCSIVQIDGSNLVYSANILDTTTNLIVNVDNIDLEKWNSITLIVDTTNCESISSDLFSSDGCFFKDFQFQNSQYLGMSNMISAKSINIYQITMFKLGSNIVKCVEPKLVLWGFQK